MQGLLFHAKITAMHGTTLGGKAKAWSAPFFAIAGVDKALRMAEKGRRPGLSLSALQIFIPT